MEIGKRQKLRKLENSQLDQQVVHITKTTRDESKIDDDVSINTPRLERYLDPQSRAQLVSLYSAPDQMENFVQAIGSSISHAYLAGSPRSDLLLTLIQFNVFRALVQNTFALGFDFGWLKEDAVSVFNQDTSALICPSSLKPTQLQRQLEHHPWIDLFPFPALRDNMLSQGDDLDEDELCYDMVEICHAPSERSGLIVWGEPWNPSSWEATEEFTKKWPDILHGCEDLLRSTNYWRKKRGDDELVFGLSSLTNSPSYRGGSSANSQFHSL